MDTKPQSIILLWEAFDLISNTAILGSFYGIGFTLYCLCARSLYLQFRVPDKRKQAKFTLAYISFLFACTTIYLALNARFIQLAYIIHPDFPGGPLGYESALGSSTGWYPIVSGVLDLVVKVATMVIQIWRVRIIWNGVRYSTVVMILPLLLLLSYIALSIPAGIVPVSVSVLFDDLGFPTKSYSLMVTTKYVVLPMLTILVTALVILRILLVRRQCIKLMGTSDALKGPYMTVVAMLVESYALESMWTIVAAILYSIKSPASNLFLGNDSMVKVIAYFLVVYRVATGRGWTSDTKRELTSLRWDRGALGPSDRIADVQFRAPAGTNIVAMGSSVAHSESAV